MGENEDSLSFPGHSDAACTSRLSRKKRKLSRKEKALQRLRVPLISSLSINQASPVQPPRRSKRLRISAHTQKSSEPPATSPVLNQTTVAQPNPNTDLAISPSVSKPIPLAYFVDVCLPDSSNLHTTFEPEKPPRTHCGYLHFDILSAIFILCLPSEITRRTKPKEAPLVFSWVCRHWRRVALQTPVLWSAFSAILKEGQRLSHQKLLHLYLRRSRTRPLTFEISGQAGNRFTEVLLGRVERWKDVTVVIGESQKFADLFFKVSSTPLLEALTIDATRCDNLNLLNRIPGATSRMAQLRRFTWRANRMTSHFLLVPLRQLTHLDIWCPLTIHNCLSILKHCSRLITLKLDLKTESPSVAPSSKLVAIPSLTHIDLIVYCEYADFLSHFHLPALRSVRVLHRRPYVHNFDSLENFCTRSGCTLESLWINDRRLLPHIALRYLFLPCLQSLCELHILAGGVNDAFVMALMIPTAESPGQLLLPDLKRLVVGRCISSDGQLARMVTSRCKSEEGRKAGTALEMVRALYPKGKGRFANRHQEDILYFKTIPKEEIRISWAWK
ncbi:hypothetical protein FPV67DRAFT_1777644 [Lyophyllum atratum]|nr:hypothetical protein FPV67DRAFT_1777644 [Lyophyllum atratum]